MNGFYLIKEVTKVCDNPIISVIVPVYNAEGYLKKCVDSILLQSFGNFELIIIDDGSSDDSLSIIREYEKQDARIKTLSQTNQGQGAARNNGIRISRGDYITFSDSDDYFEDNCIFEKMYNAAVKNSASLVCAGAQIKELSGELTEIFFPDNITFNLETEKKKSAVYITDSRFMVSCWNKLYRADIIKENNLIFQKYGEILSEDTLFNYCYYPYCKNITVIKDKGYVQIKHNNSSSTTADCDYLQRFIKQIEYMQLAEKRDSYILSGLLQAYIVGGFDMLVNIREFHGFKISYKEIKVSVKEFYKNGFAVGDYFISEFFPVNRRYYKLVYLLLKINSSVLLPIIIMLKHTIKRILKLYDKQHKK